MVKRVIFSFLLFGAIFIFSSHGEEIKGEGDMGGFDCKDKMGTDICMKEVKNKEKCREEEKQRMCRRTCGACSAGPRLFSTKLWDDDFRDGSGSGSGNGDCRDHDKSYKCKKDVLDRGKCKDEKHRKKCRKTCGACSAGPRHFPTKPSDDKFTDGNGNGDCRDKSDKCEKDVLNRGKCDDEKHRKNCRKTCGECRAGPRPFPTKTFQNGDCRDKSDKCEKDVLDRGKCEDEKHRKKCRKTCGECTVLAVELLTKPYDDVFDPEKFHQSSRAVMLKKKLGI